MKEKEGASIARLVKFLQKDIWQIRSSDLSGRKSFWIRQLRILLLAIRGFAEDKCLLRASALTYYSLLSIVPVAAMAFGIAKGFGFEKKLERQIFQNLQGQEEVAQQIILFSKMFLENARGGLIAGIGVVLLFWAVIKLLGNIEHAFNEVWGVKKSRSLARKFSDYLSIMLICPVLLIMAGSLTVVIKSQVALVVQKLYILTPFSDVILFSLKLLPFIVIWIVFTFVYIFMPNKKVRFKSGLLGGIIAGTLFQVVQGLYITFQVGVGKFGAIYGSFAALPLFLIWLQISWLIVLTGAELSFAEQNVETYEFEPGCLTVSHRFKRLLALGITRFSLKAFLGSEKPPTAEELSRHFEIPMRLIQKILDELTESGILSEVKVDNGESSAYQPAHNPEALTISHIMTALDNSGLEDLPMAKAEDVQSIEVRLREMGEVMERSPANAALKDI